MKCFQVIVLLFVTTISYAQTCTYKQAQNKLLEFNNMMQVFNREFIAQMQKTGDSTPALDKKRLAMAEESAAVGIMMSEEFDKNNNIQYSDAVNPEICTKYDALIKKFALKNYKIVAANAQQKQVNTSCTTTTLWERYGKAIQKQQKLNDEGKITKQEVTEYMEISTYVGQYATTDLAKACEYLKKFEDKLNAE
jgi:hypothetical protein